MIPAKKATAHKMASFNSMKSVNSINKKKEFAMAHYRSYGGNHV